MGRPLAGLLLAALLFSELLAAAPAAAAEIEVLRLPEPAIKPRAEMGADGTLHVVVYRGALKQGNLFYLRRPPGEHAFSKPVPITRGRGTANGRGPIASPHIALGRDDRIHVVYPGSELARPLGPYDNPGIFYTRLDDRGTAFEPPRNVRLRTRGGNWGGQSIAADASGNVWVSFYGVDAPRGTEPEARMFIAHSADDGRTFGPESPARDEVLGACYCCAMKALATPEGRLMLFYRAAGQGRHRDMHLFDSPDGGASFADLLMDRWEFVGCPETGGTLALTHGAPLAVWEAEKMQLKFARVPEPGREPEVTALKGTGLPRYPVAATNREGETLIAWVEGVSAMRGGDVVWQLLDRAGRPVGEPERRAGVKPNSLVAVVAEPDGSFLVIL
jgi:hypothetical protein